MTDERSSRPLPRLALGALTAATLAVAAAACGDDDSSGADDALAARQAEVADRGADVMPFDLDATMHRFEPTDDGLVQTVVADDPGDAEQIALVREHVSEEAERFAEGDFGDPATIHGDDMPGLAELEAGANAITVDYTELSDGARITYTATNPDLVAALHDWGDAQVADHGEHAEHMEHG